MQKSLYKGLLVAGIAILALFGACDSMFFNMAEGGGPPGEYTVSFDTIDAGTISPITVEPGGTIAKPADPTLTNFEFQAWYTGLTFSTRFYFEGESNPTPVTRNTILYALWHRDGNAEGKVTVTFNVNYTGGTNITDSVFRGQRLTPPTPTQTGHSFNGWFDKDDGTGARFTADTQVLDHKTVYADWTAATTYTVTFIRNYDSDDNTPVHIIPNIPENTTISPWPGPPGERPGYTFINWTRNEDGSGGDFTDSTPVNGTFSVYAQWAVSYEVTFNANGGTIGGSLTTKEIATIGTDYKIADLPTVDNRLGWKFVRWDLNNTGTGGEFHGNTTVSDDIEVFAHWARLYTITFDANGGDNDPPDPISDTEDKVVELPDEGNLQLDNHTFTGWKRYQGGLSEDYVPGRLPGDDTFGDFITDGTYEVTLYAHWEPDGP